MNIHYRVQHAAGRDDALARLLALLPPAVEVVTDRETADPNPMRNYLRCLSGAPPDATHLCIVQDDVLPSKRFEALLQEAVGARPADLISLFVGGLSNRTRRDFLLALKANQRWSPVYFRDIHHVVAMVWPVALAEQFVQWFPTARVPGPKPPRSDDAVVGFWARTTKRTAWATVPCLVEHPDDVPSTIHSPGRQGDRGRRAIAFVDDMT